MNTKLIFTSIFLMYFSFSNAQNLNIDPYNVKYTKASKVIDESKKRGVSSSVHIFEKGSFYKINESYVLKFETSSKYTCFGVGLLTNNINIPAGNFKFAFQTEIDSKNSNWGKVKTGEGESIPSENITGMYWSELFFAYDENPRNNLFIVITPPNGISIDKIRIDVMDLSAEIDSSHAKEILIGGDKSGACPAAPSIIQRADWCGSYTACTNASYTPTTITPTHLVVHHGASPDTYTDGYAVVRSYWNYHVNTLGWSDIGYNYLFDKFGNIFLGRKNSNYLTIDVQGAHAGASNSKSIGINFLGNGDVTQPTEIQLQKVYSLLAWWFKSRNLDPLGSATLTLQSGGSAVKPRILGHKDTNIGGTACPGTVIYSMLGSIRTETANLINACNTVQTAQNLSRTVGSCPDNNVIFSWSNSGTGWYIQISNSSSFTNPYIKYVSNLTSYTGPTGFVLQSDMATPLVFSEGQTYYWRIYDNSSFVNGSSFSINSAPSYPGVISGSTNVCVGTTYTYSINAVSGATSYNWTVPSGATITSGQNTTSINIIFSNTSGNVAVSAINSCGSSSYRTLSCTTSPIASQPGAITGLSSVCNASTNTYSISAVSNATSYTWSVPNGSSITSGQGSTSISVNSGSNSGNISVVANNSCGTSSNRTITVTVNSAPSQPTAISGSTSMCSSSNGIYSISAVSNATSYTWSVPNGSSIVNGQGTTSINLNAGTTSGQIAVTASNSCGVSNSSTLSLNITSCSDITAPTTALSTPTWATSNGFTATFTDTDETGGSGLKYRFYQVSDLNGTERRSNASYGFFNDNFNSQIHNDWTLNSGTWTISSGKLNQTNQTSSNTNLYASVNQSTGNQYLYNWKMSISGTGTNRRAGLHFFCEDASQSNRLNSYMVYFRADGNVVQIYEYLNNVMYLRQESPCTVTPGTTYDYKVILNTVNGEINVYQNDILKASWTDTSPLTVGNQISLRTGECTAIFDDLRVFKSRGTSANISVGNDMNKEVRYQNSTASDLNARVCTIVTDIAKNISSEHYKSIKIDFWGPYVLSVVRDGSSADISTQTSTNTIIANWDATSDPNNTISTYYYAIGTTPGGTNICNWTSAGTNLTFTKTGLSLVVGTTYYISVKSKNAAGIYSTVKTSNGVKVVSGMLVEDNNEIISETLNSELIVYPNPASTQIFLDADNLNNIIQIYDVNGSLKQTVSLDENKSIDISTLNNGIYYLNIIIQGKMVSKKIVKE